MEEPIRHLAWPGQCATEECLAREWLVTNGLGGYASGTVVGVATRRFHGLLVAALPAPLGRLMMFNHLAEFVRLADKDTLLQISGEELTLEDQEIESAAHLTEFRLEAGLPVWRYEVGGLVIEKRLMMPHLQNTVHISWTLISGAEQVKLQLRPGFYFRPHEGLVSEPLTTPYTLTIVGDHYEIAGRNDYPSLRMLIDGAHARLTLDREIIQEQLYTIEANRGYDAQGVLWTPGYFTTELIAGQPTTLTASTESWLRLGSLTPTEAFAAERERRRRLLLAAPPAARAGLGAELVLAADQFIITPAGRAEDAVRVRAAGDDVRTVIAGYHWFTDWGRDTMISLEGLTLSTGRYTEAGWILRTFAQYVRDGLIPNMFPEGQREGLYHTADATLWFFHALDRYLEYTNDRETLRLILPKLQSIVAYHLQGTRFGIGVDEQDDLLRQGAEGYQLTWMDAKVGDWVVTPRRGKAVEINALWYNALRLLEGWLRQAQMDQDAQIINQHAARTRQSFNERFWYAAGNYLYDVIDGAEGHDAACRPNQLLAFSLKHPILQEDRWAAVLKAVNDKLLTPVGLRSLAPGHKDYKEKYYGDLRARDAAYHQGTVWGWLIGPFVDAWLKVHPEDVWRARRFVLGFQTHLDDGAIGSISEIFDAEAPYQQRGCVAQAWSVAEALRCWVKTAR